MNNIKRVFRNSIISISAQIINLILSFAIRKIFIIFLEVEYLGYQSLFSNIFSLISVAEMGIGGIITYQLYSEVCNENHEQIGKLMLIYKWAYRIIAVTVLVAGLALAPFLPYIIKDATREWSYLYIVYFIQLVGVFLGYCLSYRSIIFIVNQREYETVLVDLLIGIVVQCIQILSLVIFADYILFIIIQLFRSVIGNIIIYVRSNKSYPYLKNKYRVTREDIRNRNLFSDIRNFMVHRISLAVYGGTDNIVISAICGIRNVALFNNYFILLNSVTQLLLYKVLNPVRATIGNVVYSGRCKDELWKQFEMLEMLGFFLSSYLALGFLTFFQPAIELWLGKEYLLSFGFVSTMCAASYLGAVWEIVWKYRSVFGEYEKDRGYMVLSAILNIVISVFLAKIIGIIGVQIGTLIAFIPIAYGRIKFVVRGYFQKSLIPYFIKHGVFLLAVVMEGMIITLITMNMDITYLALLLRVGIWIIVPFTNIIVLSRTEQFRLLVMYLKRLRA